MGKVLVAVKRVVDYQVKIRIRSDHLGVETNNVKMSMNPFDEIALEEALRWKERHCVDEVIVVSIGHQQTQETLRHALALGADRALHVLTDFDLEPLAVAKVLQAVVALVAPDVVILGKQAIDDDCNQTGQMLAGLLHWPQGTFASNIEWLEGRLRVTREVDAGLETVELRLPAVVTADLRLNEPRYATLPNIMKSKSKPLTVIPLAELAEVQPKSCETLHVEPPVKREAGIKVNTIKEIMAILKRTTEVLP